MDLTALIASVRSTLDDTGTTDPSDDEIIVWLNEANVKLASELEDLEDAASVNLVAGTAGYALPSDFLRLEQAQYNGIFLKPITRAKLKTFAAVGNPTTSQTGTSEYCYVRAGSLWLFPAPDTSLTAGLVLWYYKKPAVLAVGVECQHDSSLHYLLPYYACFLGYQKDMYTNESQIFYNYWMQGLENAREWMEIGEDRIELGQIYDPGD